MFGAGSFRDRQLGTRSRVDKVVTAMGATGDSGVTGSAGYWCRGGAKRTECSPRVAVLDSLTKIARLSSCWRCEYEWMTKEHCDDRRPR